MVDSTVLVWAIDKERDFWDLILKRFPSYQTKVVGEPRHLTLAKQKILMKTIKEMGELANEFVASKLRSVNIIIKRKTCFTCLERVIVKAKDEVSHSRLMGFYYPYLFAVM